MIEQHTAVWMHLHLVCDGDLRASFRKALFARAAATTIEQAAFGVTIVRAAILRTSRPCPHGAKLRERDLLLLQAIVLASLPYLEPGNCGTNFSAFGWTL